MKYLKYLFALPVTVNLAGQLLGNPAMTGISKPFLMPLIALSIFLVAKERGVRDRRVKTIILALLFGALGDIFLMIPGIGYFLSGMLAFLIGHIFYFCTLPAPWKVKGVTGNILSVLLFIALLAGVLTLASRFPLKGPLRIAVLVYASAFAFLIHACIVAAIDRKKPIYLLTALGFLIFAFSDTFVAIGAFTDLKVPNRGFIVMSTYIAAQLVVSFSLLAEEIYELTKTEYGIRVKMLYSLLDALKARDGEFVEAFRKDFGKGEFETYTTELGFLYSDIGHILNHLRDWMEPRAVPTPFVLWPARSRVFAEPYGKVLVIGPFNYPLHLAIAPLAAALAAGNTAVVKPSRQTPAVSKVVSEMLRDTFPENVVEVVDPTVSNDDLLARRFDYIFFTGSPRVGKIVMEAASKNLTPVTLELGGKSPAIVCAGANVRLACERIAKGKFLNAGQTCVAPDYVLVHESVHEEFISTMKDVIDRFFGDISTRPSEMTLMATKRHFDRVASLIPVPEPVEGPSDAAPGSEDRATLGKLRGETASVGIGGYTDPAINYISPTVIDNCGWDDPAMQDEIFGPVLPVIVFKDLQTEVIDKVKAGEKPLSLYIFSKNRSKVREVLSQVSFGGGCVNDTVMHLGNENLPFGGVGNSGMGSYHGRTGFETFSHMKSVLLKSSCFNVDLLKPPYGKKIKLIKKFYK